MPSDHSTVRSQPRPCSHRPTCPGCPRYGDPRPPETANRRFAALCADAGAEAPQFHSGSPMGYRHRVRLSVRGRANSPKIGIFQQGSHRIADIPDCRIHHPLVNRISRALKQHIRRTGVAPYADRPHLGDLRGIQIVVERRSRTAQLVLIGNGETPAPLESLIRAVEQDLGSELHSLWWNGNPSRTNAILGPHWQHVLGPNAVRESIGGADVHFPPGAFGQSNLGVADQMVERIASWVPDQSRIVELYCGTGAIGLGLVERSRSVDFNEVDPHSLDGLDSGIAGLTEPLIARTRVHRGSAADFATLASHSDVLIVDPPRKGLDATLRAALAAAPPANLIYASCDFDSFARDSHELLAGGRLSLMAAEGYVFLPYTEHLETLAHFTRRSPERDDEEIHLGDRIPAVAKECGPTLPPIKVRPASRRVPGDGREADAEAELLEFGLGLSRSPSVFRGEPADEPLQLGQDRRATCLRKRAGRTRRTSSA